MENKITPPWTKGLIISLVLIVYGLILYFSGQSQNKSLGWVQMCLLVIGLIYACIQFAKQKEGNVTFGNVFAHGFKTTAAVIVIMVVYTVIALKLLFPEMVEMGLTQARVEMEKKGTLSETDVENGVQMVRKFFIAFAVGGIVFGFGIIGAIGSLIGAAVAKKNPNYNPIEQ